jgi:hypothetical protein
VAQNILSNISPPDPLAAAPFIFVSITISFLTNRNNNVW